MGIISSNHGGGTPTNARRHPSGTIADSSATPGPRELPHLATFAGAAERGSFTDAAAELGVTQAAVTQRIAALEQELRVARFNRRAGRIALTEAGERLYELARRIIDLHEEARESKKAVRNRNWNRFVIL
jgi:LysR family glycine cleavage system transcriptional activator